MFNNPSGYAHLKKRIISDFQEMHPNVKVRFENPRINIKEHKSWGGITRFKGNGNCDVFIPPGGGPTAIKVLAHELIHCARGQVTPICLSEFEADRGALKILQKYGVPITDNILKRVYKYQVETLRKDMKKGVKIPQQLAPLKRDVEIWNELGEQYWMKNVRDANLSKIMDVLEV